MATRQLQTPIAGRWGSRWRTLGDAIEVRLEAERERIALWLPVALGAGIASWLSLPTAMHWIGALLALSAGALAGLLIGWQRRLGVVWSSAAASLPWEFCSSGAAHCGWRRRCWRNR